MKTLSIKDLLGRTDFARGMSADDIEFLSGCASFARFSRGEFMMLAGDPCDHFYLIREGKAAVEVESGNQVSVIYAPSPGDIVGWSWTMPPSVCRYDVRVMDSVSAIDFDARCVLRKCEEDNRFGYHVYKRILEVVIERLMATRVQMLDMYS